MPNPKYKPNSKNGGIIPALKDKRVFFVPVACGECEECFKKKANNWRVRMLEDIKYHKNGKFVTLTLSNESYRELYKIAKGEGYDRDNSIVTIAVRRFLERFRKKHKKSVRHWLVSELGHNGTENIHLHGILFCDNIEEVCNFWEYGFVWKGYKQHDGSYKNYVNAKTINYIIKYVTKRDLMHKTYKPIVLCSSGIGRNYTESENFKRHKFDGKKIETYKNSQGYEMNLPMYYRNKAYSEEERELLWIEKLDKGERWLKGVKYNIKNDETEFLKALEYLQRDNMLKGFGNGNIDFELIEYEHKLRLLKQQERLKK